MMMKGKQIHELFGPDDRDLTDFNEFKKSMDRMAHINNWITLEIEISDQKERFNYICGSWEEVEKVLKLCLESKEENFTWISKI